MQAISKLSLVIQAGGESRRMGQDKALVMFHGEPLVVRLVRRLSGLAAETIVTTNRPEHYDFLGIPLASDHISGMGALGGLHTALSAASQPLVAVVACDMPFANPDLLAAETTLLVERMCDAVVPRSAEGLEPFHAVYRRELCLPLIEAALKADKRRVDAWFSQAEMCFMLPDEVRRFDPNGRAFINVNTPEELAAVEALED